MKSIVSFFVLASCAYIVSGNDCLPFDKDINSETCNIVDEDGNVLSIPANNCTDYEQCCYDGKICYNKFEGSKKPPKQNNTDVFERPEGKKVTAGQRFIGGGGLCLPPKTLEFPDTCKFEKGQSIPYVYDPPVDVPYCVRIPCSNIKAEQEEYDSSIRSCGVQPGCYFDNELAALREVYPSILPGVPVCHFAIRSAVFQVHARKVVKKYGFWNPYFTYCLLETFKEDIHEEALGCKFITYLKAFKILPKLAGWEGTTSNECRLIGGCWRSGEGCFYPAEINKVDVKSGQRVTVSPFETKYGRPKCQHFDATDPYGTLISYHKCLSAGCSVDLRYSTEYSQLMFEIGKKLSAADHWEYWTGVQEGRISSKEIFEGIRWKPSQTSDSSTPAPTVGGLQPGLAAFLAQQSGGFQQPFWQSSFSPTGSLPKLCGKDWRILGYRPCPPKVKLPPPPPPATNSCPYKPIKVPNFEDLKGSFKGCCEINPCYISKRDIREMHSGATYYYTEWGEFGQCSTTTGNGVYKRIRKCISHDRRLCVEDEEETKLCGNWEAWGSWSSCPGYCRTHRRKRKCSTNNTSDCPGGAAKARESRRCKCFGK